MIFSSLPLFHGEFSVSEKLSNADRCGTVHANRKFRLIYWSVSCAKAIVFHEFTFPIHANKSIFTMQKKRRTNERTYSGSKWKYGENVIAFFDRFALFTRGTPFNCTNGFCVATQQTHTRNSSVILSLGLAGSNMHFAE